MKKTIALIMSAAVLVCTLASCAGGALGTTTAYKTTAGTTAAHTTAVGTTSAHTTAVTTTATGTTAGTTATTAKPAEPAVEKITLSEAELRDKLIGGWIGQMVGVAWAAHTEFAYAGKIMPESFVGEWNPSSVNNAFAQDDLYVEIPFMDAMKENGALCSPSFMAEKLRDSTFPVWHANKEARDNLRAGIEYPFSGHYLYNKCADDIDWQIECDFLGQMYPGLVNEAALRAFEIGHIMNYGDGAYGGVFVTAMHAAAYTAGSVEEIAEAGVAVIPENTKFRNVMNDVMESYESGETWEECWNKIEKKWGKDDKCIGGALNIDAKLNSAYILIGLLWGKGDFEDTIMISTRCGQDSDCNPSSAASVLGTWLGAEKIEDKYKSSLDRTNRKFSCTEYTFNDVIDLNIDLMNQVLKANGAVLSDGVWTLTALSAEGKYTPVPYEQWDDSFAVRLDAEVLEKRQIKLYYTVSGNEKIKSISVDTGDGNVAHEKIETYTYAEYGTYTIKVNIEGDKGTKLELYRKVNVKNTPRGEAACSVTSPTGGGSKNMDVMTDGYIPYLNDGSDVQYDTYDGGGKKDTTWAGVQFKEKYNIYGVEFTEGKHFHDGGWFNGAPEIEVLVNGKWEKVKTSISTPYPTGNKQADYGNNFDIYVFTFEKETECEGVRIIGVPGGSAYFISIGEIAPLAK